MPASPPRAGFIFSLFCASVVGFSAFDFSVEFREGELDLSLQKKAVPIPLLVLTLPLIGAGLGIEVSKDLPIQRSSNDDQ